MERNYVSWHTREQAQLERDVAAEDARVGAAQEAQRQRRAQQSEAAADYNRRQLQRKVGCIKMWPLTCVSEAWFRQQYVSRLGQKVGQGRPSTWQAVCQSVLSFVNYKLYSLLHVCIGIEDAKPNHCI